MNNNDIVPGFDDEKDDSLKIRLQKFDNVENCLALYLTGYIDTYNSNYFQKRVNYRCYYWIHYILNSISKKNKNPKSSKYLTIVKIVCTEV